MKFVPINEAVDPEARKARLDSVMRAHRAYHKQWKRLNRRFDHLTPAERGQMAVMGHRANQAINVARRFRSPEDKADKDIAFSIKHFRADKKAAVAFRNKARRES